MSRTTDSQLSTVMHANGTLVETLEGDGFRVRAEDLAGGCCAVRVDLPGGRYFLLSDEEGTADFDMLRTAEAILVNLYAAGDDRSEPVDGERVVAGFNRWDVLLTSRGARRTVQVIADSEDEALDLAEAGTATVPFGWLGDSVAPSRSFALALRMLADVMHVMSALARRPVPPAFPGVIDAERWDDLLSMVGLGYGLGECPPWIDGEA